MLITGKALKYGDNINTDDIMNNNHVSNLGFELGEIGRVCLLNYDPTFIQRVEQGDILVAGRNFGCGSSKPAAKALLGAGIRCVIAKSISRLFFRNSINLGLFPVESELLADLIDDGDRLVINPMQRLCVNKTKGWEHKLPEYPNLIWEIIARGGISNWVKYEKMCPLMDIKGSRKEGSFGDVNAHKE